MSFILSFAIASLAILIYWPARRYPLIFTEKLIVSNIRRRSRKTPWPARAWNWRSQHRPLTWITYDWDGTRWGFMDPAGWRRTNIGLHAINSVLVLWFLQVLGIPLVPAAMGGGIYAAAPINSAAVCSLTARAELVMCAFYLATLIALLSGWWIPAGVFAIAAWKSKESALTLPIVGGLLLWLQA